MKIHRHSTGIMAKKVIKKILILQGLYLQGLLSLAGMTFKVKLTISYIELALKQPKSLYMIRFS